MDNRLQVLAGEQAGAFGAAQAAARGIGPADLRAALRRREIVHLRRGAYATRRAWDAADADERFRLRVLATAHTRPGDAVSHHAALAVHHLPLFGHDARRVDVVSGVRQAVNRSGLWVHPREGAEVVVRSGATVVTPARAIVRTALTMGRDCAVVAGDAALHRGLVTAEELLAEVAQVTAHQGRNRALEAVLAMDEKCESVGESRTRLVLDDLGLVYESQVVIRDQWGMVLGRVDFFVEGVVLEFDGKVKYARTRDPEDGVADAGEVVWLEKRREDAIRREGHPVERVIWSDLDRPGTIGTRIRVAKQLLLSSRTTQPLRPAPLRPATLRPATHRAAENAPRK